MQRWEKGVWRKRGLRVEKSKGNGEVFKETYKMKGEVWRKERIQIGRGEKREKERKRKKNRKKVPSAYRKRERKRKEQRTFGEVWKEGKETEDGKTKREEEQEKGEAQWILHFHVKLNPFSCDYSPFVPTF